MRRTIVEPADLSGPALAELKDWLGISRPNDDQMLVDLLGASTAMCEAFTGQAPLRQTVEELVPVKAGKSRLASRPIQSLDGVELVSQDGTRSPVEDSAFTIGFEAGGSADFVLRKSVEGRAVAVRIVAGLASDWTALPGALKQGIIRMAGYSYRSRSSDDRGKALPPTSVTALWRPWRVMRLA